MFKKRFVCIKPGSVEEWCKNLEFFKVSPEVWKNNLQLSKEDFHTLEDPIRSFAKLDSSQLRQDTLSLEKRTAIILHCLKVQGSIKMTVKTFDIVPSAVEAVVHKVCQILKEKLVQK